MAEKSKTTSSRAGKKASKSTKSTKGSSSGSARKTPARRAPSGGKKATAPRAEARRKPTGAQIADAAATQLAELTSKEVEAVTGLAKADDGWTVEVEVLELRRVPNTTDVLALYEVRLDADGDLEGYQRRHRFVRGAPGEDAT